MKILLEHFGVNLIQIQNQYTLSLFNYYRWRENKNRTSSKCNKNVIKCIEYNTKNAYR